MLDYIYGIEAPFKGAFGADYEVPDALTVNNGQLRIKELINVTEWVIREKVLLPGELPEEAAEEEAFVIDHVCDTCIHNEVCDDTFSIEDFYNKCPIVMEEDT